MDGLRRTDDGDPGSESSELGQIEIAVRAAGAGAVAGMAAGLVWGGIGGRIAMRILVLTSDDRVRGLISDDGFEIGTFSVATVFLLVGASMLGAIGGMAYGLLRRYLRGPLWLVTLAVASAAAVVGGGTFVEAEGIDFRLLEPLWLAIGLFVFLPGAWGATVAITTDRFWKKGNRTFNLEPLASVRPVSWGASLAAWAVLVAIFIVGIVELLSDIDQLT